MMKKNLIAMALLLGAMITTRAQEQFFPTIRVEFEKTTSVRALMKDLQEGSSWYEQNKDRYPVSMLSYHEFIGDSTHSLYRPGKEVPVDPRIWYRPVADKNVIYTDFRKGKSISYKPVFEENFLVEDSLLKIEWKITGDVRNIAGYDCRKAVGILNDTIAVFAFYTDQLMVSGGPEGIHGLPGMILGMGIPRLHATWFATRVEVNGVNTSNLKPEKKGKKVDRAGLMELLGNLSRSWGTYGSKMLINFII